MNYHISSHQPYKHFLNIRLTFQVKASEEIHLQLPSWRPGRYELGNFAKNIRNFTAYNEKGEIIESRKVSKDCWELSPVTQNQKIVVEYEYYANIVNAGSCFVDDYLFYVNPIQCCMFLKGQENEALTLEVDIPESYKISLPESLLKDGIYHFFDFDSLVETPFMASEKLFNLAYSVKGYDFRIWFEGVNQVPEEKILKDFIAFTEYQLNCFGTLPVNEYDFLFILTPFKSYHGVEHTANTVITLGPADKVFEEKGYYDFLHISSHELYHCWNIKNIRPKVMKPYDYTQENYSNLGFIYEGLTTYMGDLILWESGVFSDTDMEKSVNSWLDRHFNNFGHENYSVAQSSWDTWLDGYELGIPNRKVSIYQDGALCMFMMDALIRKNSDGKNTLHHFIDNLYKSSKIQEEGYSEKDILNELRALGGDEVLEVWNNYIYGTLDYRIGLKPAFEVFNWEWKEEKKDSLWEGTLGIQIIKVEKGYRVVKCIDNSVADLHKIAVGDVILMTEAEKTQKETGWTDNQNIAFDVQNQYRKFTVDCNLPLDNNRVFSNFKTVIKNQK
jgi:predicted metalloprotease with PDZ domain